MHTGVQPGTGTVLGVLVGVCAFAFSVVWFLVGLMVATVVVKRKTTNKQEKSKTGDNPNYNNPVVAELDVMSIAADYEAVDNNDK